MTIETKYNIGDEVWCFIGSTPIPIVVVGIRIICDEYYKSIYYHLAEELGKPFAISLGESVLFPTKEELLKSI